MVIHGTHFLVLVVAPWSSPRPLGRSQRRRRRFCHPSSEICISGAAGGTATSRPWALRKLQAPKVTMDLLLFVRDQSAAGSCMIFIGIVSFKAVNMNIRI
jgi:hypothetical protein